MAPVLTTADRAAAGLLGAVVGAQLGLDPVPDADAPHGVRLAPAPPDSPWPAAGAVAVEAARAFTGARPDLQAFARGLAAWDTRDGRGASDGLHEALQMLHHHGVPVDHAHEAIAEPMLVGLAIGVVARHSARNIASAATHTAALLAPRADVLQATTAYAVVAAHFASGHGDAIPEVIEALKADGAPAELLAIPRRVPVTRPEQLAAHLAAQPVPAWVALEAALWLADRQPIAARGAALVAGLALPPAIRSVACAAALALGGLRDGAAAIPALWREEIPMPDAVQLLGRRLAPA